jgi:Na+-transporting methylmalonyl-CoA/oxaloacetate decarboxylase gamma subunit
MHFSPILAAAEKTHTSIMDAVPHLAGMLMVMITLTILWGVCALTAKLIQIFAPEPKAIASPVAKPAEASTATPDAHTGIPIEIIAVIAAAVTTVTGKSHRIISIKPMSTSWEKAGRQSVLTSHRLR